MIPDKVKKDMACDRIGRKLIKYLEENRVKGIIDFHLRIDSDTHFYIHAQNTDSETLDIDWDYTKVNHGSDVFGYVNKGDESDAIVNTQKLLEEVDSKIEQPFVTAKFGDKWKEHAKEHYDIDTVINIAWKNGRKAILLERLLEQLSEAQSAGG